MAEGLKMEPVVAPSSVGHPQRNHKAMTFLEAVACFSPLVLGDQPDIQRNRAGEPGVQGQALGTSVHRAQGGLVAFATRPGL